MCFMVARTFRIVMSDGFCDLLVHVYLTLDGAFFRVDVSHELNMPSEFYEIGQCRNDGGLFDKPR